MMFLDCPACLDQQSAARCGLPAEVRSRFTTRSTDGPPDSIMISCPAGHAFSGPAASLTPDRTGNPDPGTARASSRTGRDRPPPAQERRRGGGPAPRNHHAAPHRHDHRPNNTPAYYLGHPATVWITAMRPRRHRTASPHEGNQGPRQHPPHRTPPSRSTADHPATAPGQQPQPRPDTRNTPKREPPAARPHRPHPHNPPPAPAADRPLTPAQPLIAAHRHAIIPPAFLSAPYPMSPSSDHYAVYLCVFPATPRTRSSTADRAMTCLSPPDSAQMSANPGGGRRGQRPVVPSSCSRRMSACPACRAVSLVMCATTHRSVCRLPSTGTAKRACGSPAARIARSLSSMAAR